MKACDLNGSGDGNALVPHPTIQPERLVFMEKFVKTVCPSSNGPEGLKWKCQQIAWCVDEKAIHERGLPLTRQQLGQQSRQDEGGLISAEWNVLSQEGLLAKMQMQQQQQPFFFFSFVTGFQEEMCEGWGPV